MEIVTDNEERFFRLEIEFSAKERKQPDSGYDRTVAISKGTKPKDRPSKVPTSGRPPGARAVPSMDSTPSQRSQPIKAGENFNEECLLVFGWAYVSENADGTVLVDSDGDSISIDVLEEAAYRFCLEDRGFGVMHTGKHVGHLIESMVFTQEKLECLGIDSGTMQLGWWVGVRVYDSYTIEEIEAGRLRMFSIEGTGVRSRNDS